MLEVIILIFLGYKIYKLAKAKNENGPKWVIITILVWVLFEGIGVAFYASIAELDLTNIQDWASKPQEVNPSNIDEIKTKLGSIFIASMFGIGCGYLGYLLVKRSLQGKTESDQDEYSN